MNMGKKKTDASLATRPTPRIAAFTFRVNLSLENMRAYLSAHMLSEWSLRDSEFFGDYIALKKKDTHTIIRIFMQDDAYLVDMLNRSGETLDNWEAEIAEFQALLRQKGVDQFNAAENNY